MITGQGDAPPSAVAETAGDAFARDWQATRADADIQFEPVNIPEPQQPDWLIKFFEWLGELMAPAAGAFVAAWPVLKWVLLALVIAGMIYLLYRLIDPATLRFRSRSRSTAEEWLPEESAVLALLEEADRLAAEGRFDEATHLLLQRSVGQIAEVRPDLVDPSTTAREIAAEPELPEKARGAFGVIATRVERSLFALRALSADDWQAARQAYADFALVRPGAAA